MKTVATALALLFLAVSVSAKGNLPSWYDPGRDAAKDLEAAKNLAGEKKILMIVGGGWCRWCHDLEAFLEDQEQLREELSDVFLVLKVYRGKENMNDKFLSGYPQPNGYPFFYILDNRGNLLGTQETGVLESDDSYDKKSFSEFIDRWK
ncbi:MAG: DUF255 domain-containing protein [Deferrisomatales bacterium]|nr:DUF255 domain-containing protein [Deferrisomatales bacterium]